MIQNTGKIRKPLIQKGDNFLVELCTLDEYYKDGQLVRLPHASHMTLGERGSEEFDSIS